MGPLWRLASESAMLFEAAPVYIAATACQLDERPHVGESARRACGSDAATALATIPAR
jgi:hypothetical protein